MKRYYILSLKHSVGDHYTWWRPGAWGYTRDLNQAGIFTEDEIEKEPSYFSNDCTMPVEVGLVNRSQTATIVINDTNNQIVFNIEEHLSNQLQEAN
ncbi:hypothetical protein [Geomicrobium sediminis]|uniref:Uncharacterized protein n=1 Tax=Geomicrobium sediminis TaxID=1347788 RepID=A0ABS2PEU0_9BACL|nr:hypothetical protein [Geomicrobium sediminis]MBM7633866.1 hypothetical protein [Geomicrobium sediminis]